MSNAYSLTLLQKAENSSGHDKQHDGKIVHTSVIKLVDSLPKSWIPEPEEYCCPLFPFCIRKFRNPYALKWHVFERHEHNPFPQEHGERVKEFLSCFIADRGSHTKCDEFKPRLCEYKGCQRSIGTESEFMKHIIEHAKDTEDQIFQENCMSVLSRIMNFCHTQNAIPKWKEVIEPELTDSTVILKQGMHYEIVECDGPIKDAPWVAITSDPAAIPELPKVYDDGGLLVAKGQVRICNNNIQLKQEYDEDAVQPFGAALVPIVEGEAPKTGPIFLSYIDQLPEELKAFAAMLYHALSQLNLNIAEMHLDHITIPWTPPTVCGTIQELSSITVNTRDYKIEIPVLKPDFYDLQWPVPILAPKETPVEFPVPVLTPVAKPVSWEIPVLQAEIKEKEVTQEIATFRVEEREVVQEVIQHRIEVADMYQQVARNHVELHDICQEVARFSVTPVEIEQHVMQNTVVEKEIKQEVAKNTVEEVTIQQQVARNIVTPVDVEHEIPATKLIPKEIEQEVAKSKVKPVKVEHEVATTKVIPKEVEQEVAKNKVKPVKVEHEVATTKLIPKEIQHEIVKSKVKPVKIEHEIATTRFIPKELKQEVVKNRVKEVDVAQQVARVRLEPVDIAIEIPRYVMRPPAPYAQQETNTDPIDFFMENSSEPATPSPNSDGDSDPDPQGPEPNLPPPNSPPTDPTPEREVWRPEDFVNELKEVSTREELEAVIVKWREREVDAGTWRTTDNINEQPITNEILLRKRIPGAKEGSCPFLCGETHKGNQRLTTHLQAAHHEKLDKLNTLHTTLGAIFDRPTSWNIVGGRRRERRRRALELCPHQPCNTFCATRTLLWSHLHNNHATLEASISKLGWFWGPVIAHIKAHQRSPTLADFIRVTPGLQCPTCGFISATTQGLRQHLNSHPENRREGAELPKGLPITLKPLLLQSTEEVHTDETSTEESTEPEEIAPPQNIRPAPAPVPQVEVPNPEPRENIEHPEPAAINPPNRHRPDTETLLRKARKWCQRCEEEEAAGSTFPRLTTKLRRKLAQPLKILFDNKIKELTSWIAPDANDETEFFITEGIFAKIKLLLRRTIRATLRIPQNARRRRRVRGTEYTVSRDLAKKIFTEQELVSLLEKLIYYKTQQNTAANRNKLANLQRHIIDTTANAEATVVRHLFGNNAQQGIDNFLEDTEEHREAKLQWLRSRIDRELTQHAELRHRKHDKTIRDFYDEDPKRCLSWFVTGDLKPECQI